jgi:N-acetylmuramoyl-L-alanine amidase
MSHAFSRGAITAFLTAFVLVATSLPLNLSKISVKTIVIDAGHGGKDSGCHSHDKKTFEKDVSLDIALQIGKMLKDSMEDVHIVYTRNTDVFVPLWQRAEIANNAKADLFISVHCNAATNTKAKGTETFIMGLGAAGKNLAVSKRENSSIKLEENFQENESYSGFDPDSDEGHIILSLYQNAYREQSLKLAAEFQDRIEVKDIRHNRGVKEDGFVVLWKTAMPSILVESGFLTNAEDRKFLQTRQGQNAIAQCVFESVKKYKTDLESQ